MMGMKTILIVDDEADVLELLKMRFAFNGFKCITAKDSKQALKLPSHNNPALIILDLMLPKTDGLQVYKILKADKRTSHIPIIVYTAKRPENIVKKGQDALDIIDYIMKPFDSKFLVAAAKEAIKKPRPR